jgi:unconventional prefoldin RPB5 interactor 1
MDDSGLLQVERQRSELEASISKLRTSLQHWQTWEIEYEGLREEIASLPDGSNTTDVLAIARDFGADLVDEKELQTIVGGQGGSARTQRQIVDLLAKRVDYVSRNARNIEKQLSDAQKKRNALLLAEEPDFRNDAGLPLTDITEELDDEGNVVSSKLETPGSTAPQLVEVLKKAGVKDLFDQGGIITSSKRPSNGLKEHQDDLPGEKEPATKTLSNTGVAVGKDPTAPDYPPKAQSEDDIKLDKDQTKPDRQAKGEYQSSHTTPEIVRQMSSEIDSTNTSAGHVSTGHKREERNADEDLATMHPDDTPEEAMLRHEMLQYGLGEVGAIVAELDLEENESEFSTDVDGPAVLFDSDLELDDIDDEDESEDENGMVKHPTMSRKYLEKMKELEEKHGIKAMQNLGPNSSKLPQEVQNELNKLPAAEAARKAALSRAAKSEDNITTILRRSEQNSMKPRKKVAFAENLDIAPETGPQTLSEDVSRSRPERLNLVEPIKDSIVERQSSAVSTDTPQSTGQARARRPSKFKAAREATPQTPLLPPSPTSRFPQQPPNKEPKSTTPLHQIHAANIIERDTTKKPNPPQSDDVDEEIHRQEIAGEYYKLRNRMIQRQGGFVGDGEADNYGEEVTPLPMMDENGKEKKISRFKAARLK